jgi:prevent-host-death family protein
MYNIIERFTQKGVCDMVVTATEFKTNLGKYITLADMEDIIITRNGRSVAKLTNARDAKLVAIHSMRGLLKGVDVSADDIRTERLTKYDEALD